MRYAQNVLSINNVISQSWQLYKDKIGTLIVWSFLNVLALWLFSADGMGALMGYDPATISFEMSSVFLSLAFFLSTLFTAVLYYLADGGAKNMALDMSTVLLMVKKKFLRLVVVNLGMVFIMVIGFALFIVPGIILAIFLLFAIPSVLLNNSTIVDAFKHSFQLVWKHWWQTLGTMVPVFLLSMLVSGAGAFFGHGDPWISFIFRVLLLMLVIPFAVTTILVQYNNLKIQQQG